MNCMEQLLDELKRDIVVLNEKTGGQYDPVKKWLKGSLNPSKTASWKEPGNEAESQISG